MEEVSIATSLSLSLMTSFEWNREFYCFPLKKKKKGMIIGGRGREGVTEYITTFFLFLGQEEDKDKSNILNSLPRPLAKGFPHSWAAMLRKPWLGKQCQELCCCLPSLPSPPTSPSSLSGSCGEMLLPLGSHRQAHHSNLCAHQTHSHISKEYTLI